VLTDSAEGMLGHQRLFGVLALFALLGVACTLMFGKLTAAAAQAEAVSSGSRSS